MKNRNFLKNSIRLLLPSSLVLGVLFGVSKGPVKKADAYTSSGLPTTIHLKDTEEEDIRKYYSSLNNLDTDQRSGTNLLKNLKGILKNGQKYYSYESGTNVWRLYEITDRDWEKSPASEIPSGYGTYDAKENIIYNYKYGSSVTNDKGSNPYLHAFYVDRSIDNPVRAWDYHGRKTGEIGIDREHLWAKSQGFETSGAGGARGDPMHLVAAESFANGAHSAYSFGNVDKSRSYSTPECSVSKNNYVGYAKRSGVNGKVFEPQDSDKGDIARALFYMAARYNTYDGDTNIDSNNPNLILNNSTWDGNSDGYQSTASRPGEYGIISDLLEWNKLDPVDEYERHRNNLLYTNFTNNRNPFVDFPDWADLIWGGKSGYATPSSDSLNGGTVTKTVSKIEIISQPTKYSYVSGESFSSSGMVVKATFSDGTTNNNLTGYTVSPAGALTASDTYVTISYEDKTAIVPIFVSGGSVSSLSQFKLCTSESDLVEDGKYIIVGNKNGNYFAMKPYVSGNNNCKATSISSPLNCLIDLDDDSGHANESDAAIITLGGNTGNWTFFDGTYFLYAAGGTGDKNYLKGTNSTSNLNTKWKISFTDDNKAEIITADTTVLRNTLMFNSGDSLFACYASGQNPVYLYKQQSSSSVVSVTGVSLDVSTISSMEVGDNELLSATVAPEGATNKNVIWSTSDSGVVTVNNGQITAVASGNAIITVTTMDGSKSATCSVHVNSPITLESIVIDNSSSQNRQFYLNDEFTAVGIKVSAIYSDGHTEDVTEEVEFSGYDMSQSGNQTVIVSYNGKTTSYSINVSAVSLPDNTSQFIFSQAGVENGENLSTLTDTSGEISVEFSKGTGSNIPKYYTSGTAGRLYGGNSFTISDTSHQLTKIQIYFGSSDGTNAISVNTGDYSETGGIGTWTGNAASVTFTIGGTSGNRRLSIINATYDPNSTATVSLSSLEISGSYKTEYNYGDSLSTTGMIFTAKYSDGSSKNLGLTDVEISGYSSTQHGTQTITVSYSEDDVTKTATFDIVVSKIITGILLSGTYPTTFYQGGTFTKGSMKVTATYSDNTTEDVTDSAQCSGYDLSTTGPQTVTVSYNGKSSSYTITVEEDSVKELIINTDNATKTFESGDTFDSTGVVVTAVYYSGKNEDVTDKVTWTEPNMVDVGNHYAIANYEGVTKRYTITIIAAAPRETLPYTGTITNGALPEKWSGNGATFATDYYALKGNGQAISSVKLFSKQTSIVVGVTGICNGTTTDSLVTVFGLNDNGEIMENCSATYVPDKATASNGQQIESASTKKEVVLNGSNITGVKIELTTKGHNYALKEIKISTYSGQEKELVSISLSNSVQTEFCVGDEFSFGGTVTATYSDNSEEDVTNDASFTGYDMSKAGQQTVTVTYGDATATYSIAVKKRDLYAPKILDFDLTKNPGNWPTENSTALTNYSYSLKGTDYTFSLKNVKCNSGYLMLTNPSAALGLPAIDGYKLTKAVLSNSGGCSTGVSVGISSTTSTSTSDCVDGGKAQKWSTTNSDYTYDLTGTQSNTMYYIVASSANAQIVNIELTYTPFVEIGANDYSLVTDVNDLRTGDEIIFAGVRSGTYYTMNALNSTVMSTTILTTSSNGLILNENTMSFTIEKSSSGFRFRNKNNQYLSTASSGYNDCKFESDTLTNNSLFSISSKGDAMDVAGLGSFSHNLLKYNYNNGKPRFTFYASNTTAEDIYIYKKTSQIYADSWAKSFLESTDHCNVSDWLTLKSLYNNIQDIVKEEISGVEANASTDYSLRAQAMARYDYMLARGDIDKTNNFISERGVAGYRPVLIGSILLENDNTLLIAIISLVGVSIIGGYFFVKRRKNEEL